MTGSLENILPSLVNEGCIVFCGAGISMEAPSCSPSWWTLTEEIIRAFFEDLPNEYGVPKDLIIKDPERQPEETFEGMAVMLESKFYEVFKALDVSKPNNTHIMLARLAKAGILKACFTTNFDVYLEKALREEGVKFDLLIENSDYEKYYEKRIVRKGFLGKFRKKERFVLGKLHGSIEDPDTIISVASAYKTIKGFSGPKESLFGAMLEKYPCLFLGYSGWDFTHENYRKFWSKVGPKTKRIIWGKRPGEDYTIDIQSILQTKDFSFVDAELPDDLGKAIKQIKKIKDQTFSLRTQEEKEKLFAEAKVERIHYFKTWAKTLPKAHVLGLVMTESQQFSSRFKEAQKKQLEHSNETQTPSFDYGDKMKELGEKLAQGEIDHNAYQKKIFEMQFQTLMNLIKESDRDAVMSAVTENKFPGVTDNEMYRTTFISFLSTVTRKFSIEEALELVSKYMKEIITLSIQDSEEARTESLIISSIIPLLHPDEELWKPYADMLHDAKKQKLAGDITEDELTNRISEVTQNAFSKQAGFSIDFQKLFQLQLEAVLESEGELFTAQSEAFVLTMMHSTAYLHKEFSSCDEYKELLKAVTTNPGADIEKRLLDNFDASIRKKFSQISEKAGKNEKLLLEILVLSVWIDITQWLDPEGLQQYQKMWSAGEYPKRCSHRCIFDYLHNKLIPIIEETFTSMPSSFVQKFCGKLALLAEMGNDITLSEKATFKSLKLTRGMVTEATPPMVPDSLAAFYERSGDMKKALKYYTLSLKSIHMAIPPIWTDAIVYRTALLLHKLGKDKEALDIIDTYHPAFGGKATCVHMPAREKTLELRKKLA